MVYSVMFFPSAKRHSNFKLILNFAVNIPIWIRALKQNYNHIDEILQVLDSQTRLYWCRAEVKKQEKKSSPPPEISISEKAHLRKQEIVGEMSM